MIKERFVLVDGTESWKITAPEGKAFSRKSDGIYFGEEIYLGYRYRDARGNLLDVPVLEVPEDFEEIDSIYEDDIEDIEDLN